MINLPTTKINEIWNNSDKFITNLIERAPRYWIYEFWLKNININTIISQWEPLDWLHFFVNAPEDWVNNIINNAPEEIQDIFQSIKNELDNVNGYELAPDTKDIFYTGDLICNQDLQADIFIPTPISDYSETAILSAYEYYFDAITTPLPYYSDHEVVEGFAYFGPLEGSGWHLHYYFAGGEGRYQLIPRTSTEGSIYSSYRLLLVEKGDIIRSELYDLIESNINLIETYLAEQLILTLAQDLEKTIEFIIQTIEFDFDLFTKFAVNIKFLYTEISHKYRENYILGELDSWKENFIYKFISELPAYWNVVNGDLSKAIDISNIGDFSFTGEQQTEQSDNPFGTPKASGSYSFKQKSDQELIEALKTRGAQLEEWTFGFGRLFQTLLSF